MWRLPDENGNTQHGLDGMDERTNGCKLLLQYQGAHLMLGTVPAEAVDTYRQDIKTEEILKRRE